MEQNQMMGEKGSLAGNIQDVGSSVELPLELERANLMSANFQ